MLTFGTAGLRGPMQDGPDGMNVATVARATWGVAQVLTSRGSGAGATVVIGRDTRHHSEQFATTAAEVFAAQGFSVVLLPTPLPTPILAFAVRALGAVAGVQITASHNPATDNGYKVYFEGGIQIISPTDREIETAIAIASPVAEIPRIPVTGTNHEVVQRYVERAASCRRNPAAAPIRIALTPMHGVGGEIARKVLHRAGFDDVHVVTQQFAPDPDFRTVAFPNPEEPGATDALLQLAADIDADVAIALDPDADRCAVAIPGENAGGPRSNWRLLTGDQTGWLLGDYILSNLSAAEANQAVVASSLVSSSLLAAIAAHYGAMHVETLTGFKWLARADADTPGRRLVYAYEEAIGHCVDPIAVRDKDGISAAVLVCDLVAALRARGSSIPQALDDLARRHGPHVTSAVSVRVDAAQAMADLRANPPTQLAGLAVRTEDLLDRPAPLGTDAVVFTGHHAGLTLRLIARPSGTEPKLKFYTEVACPPGPDITTA